MLAWLHWYWPAIAWLIAVAAVLPGYFVGRFCLQGELDALRLENAILHNQADRWQARARHAERDDKPMPPDAKDDVRASSSA